MHFSDTQLIAETDRLFYKLKNTSWSKADCEIIAPLTLEINQLKKEKNATILGHSYLTPDIMYGVADIIGDSYGLSKTIKDIKSDIIIFCSVHFMAETAKILNPKKTIIIPSTAGCSLAESITPEDVKNLKKNYPEAGVVCYVNTSASVKAECDACCTSSNALKVIEFLPQKQIIFLPDELMAKNLQPLTKKKIIRWTGKCIVHEKFTTKDIDEIRTKYPESKILAHLECPPSIIDKVDMAGGTEGMMKYIEKTQAKELMLVTECGFSDRIRVEHPEKKVVGSCSLCPYMKKIMLKDILQALKSPRKDQIIELPEDIMIKAKKSLDRMVKIVERSTTCK